MALAAIKAIGPVGAALTLAVLLHIDWPRRLPRPDSIFIVETISGSTCTVEIVDYVRLGLRLLRCDDTILGGVHLVTGESAFRAFVIQSAIKFVERRQATRALVVYDIGLGVGTVNMELQGDSRILVDTIEIEPGVADAARRYFRWRPNGAVHLTDARHTLRAWSAPGRTGPVYDYAVLDVFTARKRGTSALYTHDSMRQLKTVMAPGGVVAFSLVTFVVRDGAGGADAALYGTMRRVFRHVRCFIDADPGERSDQDAVNLVCFGSDLEIEFRIPQGADAVDDGTPAHVLQRFQSWEVVFADSDTVDDIRPLMEGCDDAVHSSIEDQLAAAMVTPMQ